MKKFIQIVTAAILSVGFIGSVAGAAQSTCTITNTGNGNQVSQSCTTTQNVTVTCNNGILDATYNAQNATTGNGTVSGGASSGSVATGTAVNYNGTNTTIGATCGAVTTTVTSPTPTPTPGVGATHPVAASLPNTAANDTASIIAVSLVAAAAVVGLSRASVAAYRRIGNK
jgi:hypothetical protein